MKRIFDEMSQDNQVFKKYMVDEYIEFFKNKKRIRMEWAQYTSEIQEKVDQYIAMFARYDSNIAALNSVLPVLVELSCLVTTFTQQDISVRNKLS